MKRTVSLGTIESDFTAQLEEVFKEQPSDVHLKIHTPLQDHQFYQLHQFSQITNPLPFSRLSLSVNIGILNSDLFSSLLVSLKEKNIELLELMTSDRETLHHAEASCRTDLSFSIQVVDLNKVQLSSFTGKEIKLKELIRTGKLNSNDVANFSSVEVQHVEMVQQEIVEELEEEVEYWKTLEQQEIHQYKGELIDFSGFNAPLYKEKASQYTGDAQLTEDLYNILQQELFANLPHAIKFLSPDAAFHLAENLGTFVSLNKENLPHGFFLSQTALGEYVLEFDPFLENEQANVFTPELNRINAEPIEENVKFEQQALQELINNPALFAVLCAESPDDEIMLPAPLINLRAKYGNDGIKAFFEQLQLASKEQPGLDEFLLKHYFMHLPQWEHLHENEAFFNRLKTLNSYEPQKLTCFKQFIENTGSSRHDLWRTLAAFDFFWREMTGLCQENKLSMELFAKAKWSINKGGHPAVYMERLLFIFKNARSINDQLSLLSESDSPLLLDNYGAYYASRYEGFKAISPRLALTYDREKQHQLPFRQEQVLYREDFEQLVRDNIEFISRQNYVQNIENIRPKYLKEYYLVDGSKAQPGNTDDILKQAQPFRKEDFVPPFHLYLIVDGQPRLLLTEKPRQRQPLDLIQRCYRFIAQQTVGIELHALIEAFNEFESRYVGNNPPINFTSNIELLTSLFFISHERYEENNDTLSSMFHIVSRMVHHRSMMIDTFKLFTQLFKTDVKLNLYEGWMLFSPIANMNSVEFESLGISKIESINRLLTQLQHSKLAVFKYFDFRSKKLNAKWPFLYAMDTAEVLAEDSLVEAFYYDDLLLFSGMISLKTDEAYFHGCPDESGRIAANLQQVKNYLHQAVEQPSPNNLQYTIQTLINAKEPFTYEKFLSACAEIEKLSDFDKENVDSILREKDFGPGGMVPKVFKADDADLRGIIISLITRLEQSKTESPAAAASSSSSAEPASDDLNLLSNSQLQKRLQKAWSESGALLTLSDKLFMQRICKLIKEQMIRKAFRLGHITVFFTTIISKTQQLADFQDISDVDKLSLMGRQVENLADACKRFYCNNLELRSELDELFSQVDFQMMDSGLFFRIINLLNNLSTANPLPLLRRLMTDETLLQNNKRLLELMDCLSILHNNNFPLRNIEAFAGLILSSPQVEGFDSLMTKLISLFQKEQQDPVLDILMSQPSLSYLQINLILDVTERVDRQRLNASNWLKYLTKEQLLEPVLNALTHSAPYHEMLISILARAHRLNRPESLHAINYVQLLNVIGAWPENKIFELYEYFNHSPVSAECLTNALNSENAYGTIAELLLQFEQQPFGERNVVEQFSTSEVERVVNQLYDMVNESIHSRQYRKQLMAAFLFVNEIGRSLPVYHQKNASQLSNLEIKSFFAQLKAGMPDNLQSFERRLLAVGLMREAMYRSTGEFPYSTQIIALIDCMLHQGDCISNIDTGQGKSLIDMMKAALLWLESDRVDLTTSSLVDARRDIAHYGAFFDFLAIPYSKQPISSVSAANAFQKEGVNFSTFSQLSLFFAKSRVLGGELDTPEAKVSLVINESDHAILDDRVIYRFAMNDAQGIHASQQWIYYAMNDFVNRQDFITLHKTDIPHDIDALKQFLRKRAVRLQKSAALVNKFSDEQYLILLESALLVNYVLKENEDYVIPEGFDKKRILGREVHTRSVKLLMRDGKVSQDARFGNGVQQLLYAKLNAEYEAEHFVIEPQNLTIVSSNNRNLVDYYRARKGFIWGSSGTVGSSREIKEQYEKYGFEFTKIAPHQVKIVNYNPIEMAESEQEQFNQLIQRLTEKELDENSAPSLVFCKDIETANRLYQEFINQNEKQFPVQLYTGLGQEEDVIQQAAQAGMVTISTSVLGRNTDIHYDRQAGLRVWHTFVDSVRGRDQKSGRTGRQGSSGEVNFILNAEEIGQFSIEEIQQWIDRQAASERINNETVYNLLGYLLAQIDQLPDAEFIEGKSRFLRMQWSKFSAEIEAGFREQRRDVSFSEQDFITAAIAKFNDMTDNALKGLLKDIEAQILIKELSSGYPAKKQYTSCDEAVRFEDCILPIHIPYQMLEFKDEASPEMKEGILNALNDLFNSLGDTGFVEAHNQYLEYLKGQELNQEVLNQAHREFVADWLQRPQQRANLFQNCLGLVNRRENIIKHRGYLQTLHLFASMANQPLLGLEEMKLYIIGMLEKYQQTRRILNFQRKALAGELIGHMNEVQDYNELIQRLVDAQIHTAGRDISSNAHCFFLPIHPSGQSQYQETITAAINLACALTGKKELTGLTEGLFSIMTEAEEGEAAQAVTSDDAITKANELADGFNGAVISRALGSLLWHQHPVYSEGMKGRETVVSLKHENEFHLG